MMLAIQFLIVLALALNTVLSAQRGERCGGAGDCVSTAMECIKRYGDCEEKACWCKPEYGGRFASSCTKIVGLGDYCVSSSTCGEGMRCNTLGYCECSDGWTRQDDVCVDVRKSSGGTCDSAAFCQSNLTCSAGTCKCSGYFTEVNGQCRKAHWGEDCDSNNDCEYYDCVQKTDTTGKWCACQTGEMAVKYRRDNIYTEDCVDDEATPNVDDGFGCNYKDKDDEHAKYCKTELTCSRCILDDEPTCISPAGTASGVRAHVFFIVTTALSMKLLAN